LFSRFDVDKSLKERKKQQHANETKL